MNGSRSSQLSCSRDTNMANIASRVLLNLSTNLSTNGMGSFSFSLFPVIQRVCVPWYCQITFPDLNVRTVGIRIWVAICPSARLLQSARSCRQGDKPQCTL